MSSILQFLATTSGGLFAGAALYVTVVEHPVRSLLDTRAAASQWAPSYQRATWMQAPLAIVALLTGLGACLLGAGFGWLLCALLIGAVVPITFTIIMPTNQQLLDPARDLSSAETSVLLDRWGRPHALRTPMSLLAFAGFVCLSYAR